MKYFIDTFTEKPFSGNPAGVCLLEKWIDAAMMQKIAAEPCIAGVPGTTSLSPVTPPFICKAN